MDVVTDDQLDVLRRVHRAGGSFTAVHLEPNELRLLVSQARVLERRGLVRVLSTDDAAYVELTKDGRWEVEWRDR